MGRFYCCTLLLIFYNHVKMPFSYEMNCCCDSNHCWCVLCWSEILHSCYISQNYAHKIYFSCSNEPKTICSQVYGSSKCYAGATAAVRFLEQIWLIRGCIIGKAD
ncbi:hypothetical protein TNIN_423091 [Trichonephila inaurata madagascariensis]|uniref:Secreted protein n=1 Tax=Trichonephila inaurata madagascariensis TaxID=2747483 RepID=A0A8X6JMF2_9ARAC|nr:hypothetical protein TNIN_423091 [Trichonephila inaurata madagascariensis]